MEEKITKKLYNYLAVHEYHTKKENGDIQFHSQINHYNSISNVIEDARRTNGIMRVYVIKGFSNGKYWEYLCDISREVF